MDGTCSPTVFNGWGLHLTGCLGAFMEEHQRAQQRMEFHVCPFTNMTLFSLKQFARRGTLQRVIKPTVSDSWAYPGTPSSNTPYRVREGLERQSMEGALESDRAVTVQFVVVSGIQYFVISTIYHDVVWYFQD